MPCVSEGEDACTFQNQNEKLRFLFFPKANVFAVSAMLFSVVSLVPFDLHGLSKSYMLQNNALIMYRSYLLDVTAVLFQGQELSLKTIVCWRA